MLRGIFALFKIGSVSINLTLELHCKILVFTFRTTRKAVNT